MEHKVDFSLAWPDNEITGISINSDFDPLYPDSPPKLISP